MAIDRVFAAQSLQIRPYMELGSTEAIKQGTMASLGLSILSRNNIALEIDSQLLVPLDVTGFPLMRRWYVAHLKGKQLSQAANAFLQFLLLHKEFKGIGGNR